MFLLISYPFSSQPLAPPVFFPLLPVLSPLISSHAQCRFISHPLFYHLSYFFFFSPSICLFLRILSSFPSSPWLPPLSPSSPCHIFFNYLPNYIFPFLLTFFLCPPRLLSAGQNVSFNQLSSQSQKVQERLKELEQEVSGGATAIVALILNNKLYIANVGMNTHMFTQTTVVCMFIFNTTTNVWQKYCNILSLI